MGTSGAYGGSAGFSPVRDPIQQWVGNEPGPPSPDEPPGTSDGQDVPRGEPEATTPPTPPEVLNSLKALGRALSRGGTAGGSPPGRPRVRTTRSSDGGATTRTAGGRSRTRAAAAGGSAAAAAHTAGVGGATPVPSVDLTADQFTELSPMQQAARIVDAAAPTGPRAEGESPFHDDELRRANSEFAYWVVTQGAPIEPEALVRQWLVSYVWVVWQREVGNALRQMDDPRAMQRREKEMRVALEARIAGIDVPTTGVTPTDFQNVIRRCLESLDRVFGEDTP